MATHYRRPSWFNRQVVNRVVTGLARAGISLSGSCVLEVRGRASGELRRTPVIVLELDGRRYLVSARGHTQWARNLRAAGEGRLLLGRRRERFRATEVADSAKEPVLREYLRRFGWEVGRFFDGVGAEAAASELSRIAPDHPVFLIGQAAVAP
jgi:deazaflavin-dependent oxidoreductase (nitroreductase family)